MVGHKGLPVHMPLNGALTNQLRMRKSPLVSRAWEYSTVLISQARPNQPQRGSLSVPITHGEGHGFFP